MSDCHIDVVGAKFDKEMKKVFAIMTGKVDLERVKEIFAEAIYSGLLSSAKTEGEMCFDAVLETFSDSYSKLICDFLEFVYEKGGDPTTVEKVSTVNVVYSVVIQQFGLIEQLCDTIKNSTELLSWVDPKSLYKVLQNVAKESFTSFE